MRPLRLCRLFCVLPSSSQWGLPRWSVIMVITLLFLLSFFISVSTGFQMYSRGPWAATSCLYQAHFLSSLSLKSLGTSRRLHLEPCPSFQSDRCNDSTLRNLNIQHNRINNDLIIQFHPYFLLVTCVGVSPERPKIYSNCKMSRKISYKVFKMCCWKMPSVTW